MNSSLKVVGKSLKARGSSLESPIVQRAALRSFSLPREFDEALSGAGLWPLRPTKIEIFQINVGKVCNQTCRHCHVDAAPDRREQMTRETMALCLRALQSTAIPTVDITGGAPEMNPHFRYLVEACRGLGRQVIDRCNLTILESPAHRDLPEFFARNGVEVVASLPHFRALGTDRQRGEGVFEQSISALKRLNAVGYGTGQSGLRLVLVTNPVGAFLPGAQRSLEAEWKRALLAEHGVTFDALIAITNMPISRYLEWLIESDNLAGYMERLVTAFNPLAARGVMCRDTLSVGWDGTLYDCDFNQMLDLPVEASAPRHIADFCLALLEGRSIRTDRHCFGCTAGAGSGCRGAESTQSSD